MITRLARPEERAKVGAFLRKNDFIEPGITDDQLGRFLINFYSQNLVGCDYVAIAEEQNEVIASYAAIPFRFRTFGKNSVGGLGSNLVVAPPHRHGLAFLRLQKFFLGEYDKHGIDFIYGLVTRPDVLRLHLRTGFTAIGKTPVYARPYRLGPIAARLLKPRALAQVLAPGFWVADAVLRFGGANPRGIEVTQVTVFPEDIEPFLERNLARFEITAQRNRVILDWRFSGLGFRRYEIFVARRKDRICGYVVLRPMQMHTFKALGIADILYDWEDDEAPQGLLAKVHERALALGVDLASVMHTETSPLGPALRRAGFLKTPEHFTLVVNQPREREPRIGREQYRDWHVTWFDHDFV